MEALEGEEEADHDEDSLLRAVVVCQDITKFRRP